jgi:pyruvate dehydrogenase E2 component (dihydrolipoamide acetyltransferase)
MIQDITIPDIGEKIVEGDVVGVLVKEGQTVEVDQTIIEFETDKAVVEIPAPARGKITMITVKQGDTVKVGSVIARIETDGKGGESNPPATGPESKPKTESPAPKAEKKVEPKGSPVPKPAPEQPGAEQAPDGERRTEASSPGGKIAGSSIDGISSTGWSVPWIREDVAPAAPSVRRLARELGADIHAVKGTGSTGRITMEDVKAHVKQIVAGSHGGTVRAAGPVGQPEMPDFARWGEIERQPMNRVRQITAQSMATAWNVVPHVTQFDKADITELEAFRKKFSKKVEKAGGKLTVTAILLKVLALALRKFPQFNASIDVNRNELIFKKYVHIAMAVDTDRGLLVPVIRDVDKKTITELALEVVDLAERTRGKKVKPEELEGGSFTVSNQGSIGGTDFTPIVYWPQVAILGVSRSSVEPKYVDGQVQPRIILPLALSYDHRIIDGANAARFLNWIVEALQNPLSMYFD